jgi:transcriptional regulator with GAF, ATPase, and Fis domain
MSHVHETVEEPSSGTPALGEPVPGLVAIYSCSTPLFIPIPIAEGPVELGRMTTEGAFLDDERVSRRHVRVEAARERFRVTDLGSRNGTYVDGERVEGSITLEGPRVLRMGRSLLLFVTDVRPFERLAVSVRKDIVLGPRLAQVWARITRAAQLGTTLLVTGASGTGKELAARHFHAASPRPEGPFVAVNCASIPAGVAERLLFGARKGAYSGATNDAEGYAQAANGGTLFLDEVGELELGVQPKLLRLLENGEVMPLGAARPQRVDIRVVAATLKDLRSEAAAGRFREDLFYRLGQPEVRLPALRERLEELPWLMQAELGRVTPELRPHALLVEACALRVWPGNLRELAHELRQAAQNAIAAGRSIVEATDLEPSAGVALGRASVTAPETPSALKPTDEQILEVLQREGGNVSRAARALGMHRNQLRRWLTRRGADPLTPASSPPDTELE